MKSSEHVFRSFPSANSAKFRKIRSEVCIQGKKKFGKRVLNFLTKCKIGFLRGIKETWGFGREIIILNYIYDSMYNSN
jgi:hypothetical protein